MRRAAICVVALALGLPSFLARAQPPAEPTPTPTPTPTPAPTPTPTPTPVPAQPADPAQPAEPPPPPEPPPSDDERARMHFTAGTSHFQAGEYEQALIQFRAAYDRSGRPQLAYNIALCYERLARWAEAAEWLERFLPAVANEDERINLDRRIGNLRERALAADDDEEDVTAEDADALEATPAADEGMPLGATVAFAAGGIALGAALTFGLLSWVEDGTLDDECGAACTEDRVGNLRTYTTIADVALASALVAGGIGLIVLLASGGDGASAERALADPVVRF